LGEAAASDPHVIPALLARLADSQYADSDCFNKWISAGRAELDGKKDELDLQFQALKQIKAEIDAAGRDVVTRNARIARYQELASVFRTNQQVYEGRVRDHQTEYRRREKQVAEIDETSRRQYEEYRSWRERRGAERLWSELNDIFAAAARQARKDGQMTRNLKSGLERIRKMPSDLGGYAMKQQESAENGVLIVAATLCRPEKVHSVVDTGATMVSVTPALIDVLDLAGPAGIEIEINLAGGIRRKGRQIKLPYVEVAGMGAPGVEAVILKEACWASMALSVSAF
jgi:hypothetical protein